MTDRELLELLVEKVTDMDGRLDKLENKVDMLGFKQDMTHKKLNDLSLDVKFAERGIRSDIRHLQDTSETLVVVLQSNGTLPKAQ